MSYPIDQLATLQPWDGIQEGLPLVMLLCKGLKKHHLPLTIETNTVLFSSLPIQMKCITVLAMTNSSTAKSTNLVL